MHIPDGFLSTPVWAAFDAIAIPAVSYVSRRAGSDLQNGRVPLLGVMGAFVFAAQMINFPVGVGTSGHLIGGALLAYTLGPAPASIVMTAILLVQSLVFQDGGLLALGTNIFNMAFAGVLAAWLPYRYLGRGRTTSMAVFAGAALSVLVSASLAIVELRLSGVPMPPAILGVSMGLFAISAALEGAITVAVLKATERLNRGWIHKPAPASLLSVLGGAAILLAAVVALFASASPDGLESLAGALGIAHREAAVLAAPLAGYETSGAGSPWMRKAAAGLTGLGVVFALCLVLGWFVARRKGPAQEEA